MVNMRNRFLRIGLILLGGCTLGPDHHTPQLCMPTRYEEAALESEEVDLAVFWKQFEDEMLDELVADALACNYDLQIALHKIEELRQLYRIDRSILYPQISENMVAIRARRSENLGSDVIEDQSTPTELIPADFSGPLIQNFFQTGFDAIWELDFWGKNRKRAEAALHDFEGAQENALDIQITLISDVARSYIDIRSLQHQIVAKKEQIQRQKDLLSLSQSRYCAGLTSQIDVTRAQAILDTQEASLPPLQEILKQTIHALANLLGRPPESFAKVLGEMGPIPKAWGRIPADLPSELLCRRPDIRRADRDLAAATARISVAKAEFFPSFSLMGSFGVQSNELDKLFVWPSRYWTIGPSMIWNLFTGGRLVAQVKVENERQKQMILNYEKTVIDALGEVEDRLVSYFKEEKRLEALEERISANSLLRDLSLEQYISGLSSLDEVLSAETILFASQEEMIESEGILMINLVGVYKALGGGWQCFDSP